MIPIRTFPSALVLGAIALSCAGAAHGAETGGITQAADRCAFYGPGFVDLGNGSCGQVMINGRVRVDDGRQPSSNWPTSGTATAALRSDGLGMLPGAAGAQHLRIQSGSIDPYGR